MWERRRESMGGQTPWWGGMTQARERILALARVVPDLEDRFHALQESETPGKDLLEDEVLADHMVAMILDPQSGKATDAVCQWLYESYQTGEPDMHLVVLRYIPVLCGVYLLRVSKNPDEPLAGFEAVLLALYAEESKARGGRPIVVNVPSLAQPSLYHTPRSGARAPISLQPAGYLSAPLEPQGAVKSTKRASVVGVALDLVSRKVASLPLKSKLDFCRFVKGWALQGCSWSSKLEEIAETALLPIPPVPPTILEGERAPEQGHALASGEPVSVSQVVLDLPPHEKSTELGKAIVQGRASTDGDSGSYHSARDSPPRDLPSPVGNGNGSLRLSIHSNLADYESEGPVIPLPEDLLRPIMKVLGHCLMGPTATRETKDASAQATRALYARVSHDLIPEGIISTRSLLRIHAADCAAAAVAAAAAAAAQASTPTKRSKPEVHLQT